MDQFRNTQVDLNSQLINFAIGQPDFALLPREIIQRATQQRLAEGDTELLNYGFEQGDERFRHALAGLLSEGYGHPVDADHLLVTAGASQALDLFCTLFTQPGDVVFVEEPSYFIALRILLEDHKLHPVAIPVDEEGMNLDALETALAQHRPRFVYTIPTFQNPTGRTLSLTRRERLLALAEAHDFLIVADEVYHLLGYDTPPPRPMASFITVDQAVNPAANPAVNQKRNEETHAAENERLFSVGSFSKILAPGLRLGWIQASQARIKQFVTCGLIDSGGSLNHFTSNIVRVVLEEGWQQTYLADLRQIYRRRIDLMDQILSAHLEDVATWTVPEGGYFFWLTLDESVDTAQLLSQVRRQGVGFLPGIQCSSQGTSKNCLRLSFAHYDEKTIRSGLERMAKSLKMALS